MGRRVRRWWRAAIASAAILSPQAVAAQPVHDVQIVAARFAFEPATIEVTAGERVRLVIRSKDVVHGFSIPDLKIDVQIPAGGEPITVEFAAPPPGRYDIACSEFCGTGHGEMKGSTRALVEADGRQTMVAMFAHLTRADFTGRSKHELRTVERHRVHELFDEIQIAIYNDDRVRLRLLMVKLALVAAHQRRLS